MYLPEGLPDQLGKCCRVRKGLYGLKQSARNWFCTILKAFTKLGFEAAKDPCLFKNHHTGVVIGIHVDDLVIAGELEKVNQTKKELSQIFKMKDLGELNSFLGMHVQQDLKNKKISLDQGKYTRDLLNRFGMADCTPVSSPSENYNNMNRANANDERCNQLQYQEAVGGLLYLSTLTRPDIAFEVNQFSQFCQDPSVSNWNGVLRIFRYLRKTLDYGITFGNGEPKLIVIQMQTSQPQRTANVFLGTALPSTEAS
jgi:hypothetical protein